MLSFLFLLSSEVSNFCNVDGTGQVCANTAPSGCPAPGASQTDCCLVCSNVDTSNKLDYPAYSIANVYGKLGTKTVAMSATAYNNITVYNTHNLYGLTEQIGTNAALRTIRDNKRPFLLSRSSFLSTGKHSAKWTGDNGATWDDLRSSIISILDFNLFGVPMIGADICGFIYDTTEELCARWAEVGAFYPFSRNHNAINQAPQEYYLWSTVTQAAQYSYGLRYQLLPYLYTLLHSVASSSLPSTSSAPTVANALWMNYPSDPITWTLDAPVGQFMWGTGLLITPVLTQGATSVTGYFPKGLWYDFNDRTFFLDTTSTGGVKKTLSTPLTKINVHVAGGSILPLHTAGAMTTTQARTMPFQLLVALDASGKASGSFFWDDGEQVDITQASLIMSFTASYDAATGTGSITATMAQNTYSAASGLTWSTITVMGPTLQAASTNVKVNGVAASAVKYDSSRFNLQVSSLAVPLNQAFTMTWSK